MDPEKPPRRKKSGETPVTIEHEPAPAAADDKVLKSDVEATAATGASETGAPGAEAGDAPAADAVTPQEPIVTDAQADEPANTTSAAPEQTFEPRPQPAASKSGALAAAILGGLVALAGAGALQYGGYLPALGPGRDAAVDLAPVTAEIDALKSQLATLQDAAPAEAVDLEPIETRLAALENSVASPPEAAALGGQVEQSVSALEAGLAQLTAEIAELREQAASAARGAADQAARLTERLDAAEVKLAEPQNDVTMARAVAATALKTTIDRGGPYLAELEAFASLSPDDPALAALRPHAAAGVPSRSDLVRAFEPVADDMIDAVYQPTGDQGIVDRLLSSATSAIKIRPVGSVEGDTPEAIVARIENKLQNGDLKGAQIEWQSLPEPARSAGAGFKGKLDERIAVEDGVNAIVSGAMAPMGNQG